MKNTKQVLATKSHKIHKRLLSLLCFFVANFLFVACDVVSGPADIQTLRESRPVGDTKEFDVDLKFDVGQLEITKVSDESLFSFDLQYDRRLYDPTFNFDAGDRASMRFDMNSRGKFGSSHGRDNELTLRLSDKVPLEIGRASCRERVYVLV